MPAATRSHRRPFGLLAVVALTFLALTAPAGIADGAPSDSAEAAPSARGCASHGELEICFNSPPTAHGHDGTVINRMRALFRSAGPGDELRIAMFRWEIARAADELLEAQARGARVEIVADNDVLNNAVGRRLLATVERQDRSRNNVVVCKGACLPARGKGPAPTAQDVNHLKLVLSDIAGTRSVTVTSSNLAKRQYKQYNSLVRITDAGTYDFYLDYFHRLRAQRLTVDGRTWDDRAKVHAGSPRTAVYPRRADLVIGTLKGVRCAKGMRRVDVMVAVMQRSDVRAQLARMHEAGCIVRVVVDREPVESWLQAPVTLRDGTTYDLPDLLVRTISNHDKAISIHARYGGKESWLVLTGTSNTTCGGLLYNDEVMMRLDGRWAYRLYSAHFADAFSRAHQTPTPSAVPTQKPCS